MQEYDGYQIDKDKTSYLLRSQGLISYPPYLDAVRENLQMSLPAYSVMILEKEKEVLEDHQDEISKYSIILTSTKVHRDKFQIFAQAFLNQHTCCFYIRHLVTLNHLQLIIQNKQSISMALNFSNKINRELENFKLVIDPPSGKIFFETKSFINQSSLSSLKRHTFRQDCFYTQIIYCSVRKAEKYIDLILFLLGQITLFDVVKTSQLPKIFPFLKESQQILQRLEKNIFYIPFLDMNPSKNQLNEETEEDLDVFFFKKWKSPKQQKIEQQRQLIKLNEQKIQDTKSQILNNSLQFFSQNTQNALKLFTSKNLYQNVDFSVEPLNFGQKTTNFQKTIVDIDKKSSVQSKRILSFIQIVQVQGAFLGEDEHNAWKRIYEGGFGIIDMATIKFKNLSASYKEPDTGFSLLIKQQMVRKRDKISKKNKVERERNVLQRLKYYSHPNIMSFYISSQSDYQNCIFSDYTPNMSLDVYLKKNEHSVSFNQKLSLLNQAIQGLMFLHNKNIIHLDIKPGNMLINKRLVLLLSDFGQAFLIGENDPATHNHAYTIPYCAPEIFREKAELTVQADIYAIGACIFRVIFGEHFLDTFLRRRFVKRLCEKDIISLGAMEKYQKSFVYPIIKIMMMIAYKAVDAISDRRSQLLWISQVLTQCRNFILTLLY